MAAIGRPRAFDRTVALEDAMRIFWRKGFAGTSIADLCDAMGVRSPSLYAAFGSKEALYLEAIGHYVDTIGPLVWGKLDEGATAREAVAKMLHAAAETLPVNDGAPGGCMAMLAAVGDEWPAAVAEAAAQVRRDSFDNLLTRLDAGVAAGELPSGTDTARLSRFYLGVVQGMAIQARDGADERELLEVAETALAAWPV